MKPFLKCAALVAVMLGSFVVAVMTGEASPPPASAVAVGVASVRVQAPVPVTIGDLVAEREDSESARVEAVAKRDAAQQALAEAQAELVAGNDRVARAESTLAKGLGKVGPVLIGDTVFELSADGTIRSFKPQGPDTPVELDEAPPAEPAEPN